MKNKTMTWIKILTLGYLVAQTLAFSLIFFMAYINGYNVQIYINKLGEAFIELILFSMMTIISIIGITVYVKDLRSEYAMV